MKVCVGISSVDELADRQGRMMAATGADRPFHVTRMFPRRADELLDGGSLYWTIGGAFALRQRILALEEVRVEDGTAKCRIDMDPEHVPVEPLPRRAFQGWRYLTAEDAPDDLNTTNADGQILFRALSDLGLL